MKGAAVWLASLLLFGCGKSDPAGTICTRADVNSACSQPTTATPLEKGGWSVVLRMTVTEQVPYRDGGVQCSYTRKRCVEYECNIFIDSLSGEPSTISSAEAIQECEDSYYGR